MFLTIENAEGVVSPDELFVSAYGDGMLVYDNERLPRSGSLAPTINGSILGTATLYVDKTVQELRIVVRGYAAHVMRTEGMVTVRVTPDRQVAARAVLRAAVDGNDAGSADGPHGDAMDGGMGDGGGAQDGMIDGHPEATTPDGGSADTTSADSGSADTMTADGGNADANTADGGKADTTTTTDAANADTTTADAATADTTTADGGKADTTTTADAANADTTTADAASADTTTADAPLPDDGARSTADASPDMQPDVAPADSAVPVDAGADTRCQGSSLVARSETPSSPVNLTTEGALDWRFWLPSGGANFKRTAGTRIGDYTLFGGGAASTRFRNSVAFSWTDGSPTLSQTAVADTLNVATVVGGGASLTIPAESVSRTVSVYVGGANSVGQFEASLSDGCGSSYAGTSTNGRQDYNAVYRVTFSSPVAGTVLHLKWTMTAGFENVGLYAATLK